MGVINHRKTILLLYTETGGTHRNTAEAIQEAIQLRYPDQYTIQLVDIWQYSDWPFRHFSSVIHFFQSRKSINKWNLRYGQRVVRSQIYEWISRPFMRKIVDRLVAENPCDLMVSVHPLASAPVVDLLENEHRVPFVVVINDLSTRNSLWFHPDADLLILPSDQTQKNAISAGVSWQKTRVLGVPVGMNYCVKLESKQQIRARLGLDPEKPVVLVVGGKQGVGPIRNTAEMLDAMFMDITLVIIAGRNERLQFQLQGYNWNNTVVIQGYVEEMWNWMWAADILISKAGTGMLAEALSVGLPMILFNRVPFLEDANVSYLVNQGVAIWAPTPKMVVNGVNYWLNNEQNRTKAVNACARLATPETSNQLADVLTTIADEKM